MQLDTLGYPVPKTPERAKTPADEVRELEGAAANAAGAAAKGLQSAAQGGVGGGGDAPKPLRERADTAVLVHAENTDSYEVVRASKDALVDMTPKDERLSNRPPPGK